MKRDPRNAPSFIAVDFFCGAGGTTRGLIDAGGHVVGGVDKVGDCRLTYESNNVNADGTAAAFLQRDIFRRTEAYPDGEQDELERDIENALAPLKARFPGVPLLFAVCAPCQPFTSLARQKLSDSRSEGRMRDRDLLMQTMAFIDRFEPEMVLSENVAGIQHPKNGGAWESYMAGLEARGYVVGSAVVDAARYGIPQMRKRSIMLAVKRAWHNGRNLAASGRLDIPSSDGSGRTVSGWEAISHFPALGPGESHPTVPNHVASKVSPLNLRRLAALGPGENNTRFAGTELELKCHVKLRANKPHRKLAFSDSYTRMSLDRPAPTITTKCFSFSNGRYGHPDVKQMRALSVREAAAIQTFPDDYVFHGESIAKTAKMVGNAVPPRLSEFFARELLSMATGVSQDMDVAA